LSRQGILTCTQAGKLRHVKREIGKGTWRSFPVACLRRIEDALERQHFGEAHPRRFELRRDRIERMGRDRRLHQTSTLSRAFLRWRNVASDYPVGAPGPGRLEPMGVVEHQQIDPTLVGCLVCTVARHAELTMWLALRSAQQLFLQRTPTKSREAT